MKQIRTIIVSLFIISLFVSDLKAGDNEEKKAKQTREYNELLEKVLDNSESELSGIVNDDCKVVIINSKGEVVQEASEETINEICESKIVKPEIRNCEFLTVIHNINYYLWDGTNESKN